MRAISKAFGHVRVLTDVDLTLRPGEVHALLGENGAGKSTLMKTLFGVVQPDSGTIELADAGAVSIAGPRHALSLGIGLVSQELSLVPQLDVARNMFLGQTDALRMVPRRDDRRKAAGILGGLAPHVAVDAIVGDLGMADRQLVEISRTLARGGRIIAFDEPTSSLTPTERDALFRVIRQLTASGKAIVYISHRMDEMRAIADRFTVMRDGHVVASDAMAAATDAALNELIAGRELSRALAGRPPPYQATACGIAAIEPGPVPRLALRQLSTDRLHAVDLAVRRGEVVGLAGLVGSGRSAILRAIFGMDPSTGGQILVDGVRVRIARPVDAMQAGIALIPEDRRGQAIVPMMSVAQNFGLATPGRFSRFGIIRSRARRTAIERYVSELAIRPPDVATPVADLSGGNQQKVVIARWLAAGAGIVLFDEPTRGVDVGAKAEIYQVIRAMAADGAAVLVVSSEIPELLLLSNRICVVAGGQVTRTIANDEHLDEHILLRTMGAP
ncbi:sugar ABC transporter ATP-binding protein [Lichenicoccus sp.]|uniref:sugar ABC transporter ATP-binding protein n=1 Tax=Lichenicoccus sp. TaxID=2781899 RepID=UPI003D0D4D30